jgi:hypothetical protein
VRAEEGDPAHAAMKRAMGAELAIAFMDSAPDNEEMGEGYADPSAQAWHALALRPLTNACRPREAGVARRLLEVAA